MKVMNLGAQWKCSFLIPVHLISWKLMRSTSWLESDQHGKVMKMRNAVTASGGTGLNSPGLGWGVCSRDGKQSIGSPSAECCSPLEPPGSGHRQGQPWGGWMRVMRTTREPGGNHMEREDVLLLWGSQTGAIDIVAHGCQALALLSPLPWWAWPALCCLTSSWGSSSSPSAAGEPRGAQESAGQHNIILRYPLGLERTSSPPLDNKIWLGQCLPWAQFLLGRIYPPEPAMGLFFSPQREEGTKVSRSLLRSQEPTQALKRST